MTGNGLRIGVGPAGVPGGGRRFIEFAQRAEALGFAALCVGDHVGRQGAPLPLLAAAAAVTQQLTLATHVLCNEFRNPVLLAQEARTIHRLSDGRLELGLGVGWLEQDFVTAGLPLRPFGERLEHLQKTVEIIRSDDELTPPIVIGGGGPRMLTVAGALADIVTLNIPLGSPASIRQVGLAEGAQDAFEQRLAVVRSSASERGRSVALHVYVHQVHLGPSWRDEAATAAAATGLSVDEYVASPHVLAGDVGRVADCLRDRQARYGIDYLSVPGSIVDEFADVLATVA
jgi:probable F420-dependent oxidoreductase